MVFYSLYFQNALEKEYSEAANKTVTLDHTTITVFGVVNHWLYYQKVEVPTTILSTEHTTDQQEIKKARARILVEIRQFES